jgi:guanylate kinase
MRKERGLLIVLSGPSGVGKEPKERIVLRLIPMNPSFDRRKPREVNRWCRLFFKSHEEFEQLIGEGRLLEYASYVGNYYGTPLDYVNATLDAGRDVFLEIEVQGASQVRAKVPDGLFIFLAPPSFSALEQRLVGRGTETDDVIASRISAARQELEMMNLYDYVVENDEVQFACDRVNAIVTAEHCRRERVEKRYLSMLEGES